ncbi:hypothetical protein GPJ56_004938 [Histomonas meleagridis]|uniref:uncharacterized protein n=1 Tax=Histomonas meleagridis TaxID=135588 RepID=UPI00355A34F9|nr:hypothetical protein GPJ56_004938 [Histomonas meleagridis]KAH0798536.1 hypothetical protein GO595_008401 [Histomonas meleagridis]
MSERKKEAKSPRKSSPTIETRSSENKENEVPKKTSNTKRTKSPNTKKPRKKLSKKALARLKREKAEQARLEQERLEAELREQKEREFEQKRREEQQQRILEEESSIHSLREARFQKSKEIRNSMSQEEDWKIFCNCGQSVDARSQSDVNTFISMWEDYESPDFFDDHFLQSHKIISALTRIMHDSETTQNTAEYERCKNQIQKIKELTERKIEIATIHHLTFSDKYAGSRNEVHIVGESDDIFFGIWVNLSKNPRNREISFKWLTVEIPKSVTMTSLAIRILIFPEKPFNEQYLFLNKIVQCDFFQLPNAPKHIGNMTLRQISQSNALVNVVYPLRSINAPQPPLVFKVHISSNSINEYTKDATVVMLNHDNVSQQHISKVNIDLEHNEVSFCSMSIGTFALAVPRYKHFPYQFWEITSLSESSIEIYVKTKLDLELAICIDGNGLCSMDSPFTFTNLKPMEAIDFLLERGINIVSPNKIDDIVPKTKDLENILHQGIADTVTGFDISSSKWNALLPCDRAMLLVSEKIKFDNDQQNDISKMRCILIRESIVVEVQNTEEEEEAITKPLEDSQMHQSLLPTFFEKASEEVKTRVRNAPSLLVDSTLIMMKKLRLFSITE